jgi:hypothetical protein
MLYLVIFILGVLTPTVFIPIINKFLEVVLLWIESLKVKPQMKIMNGNKDMTLLQEFIKPSPPVYDDYGDDDFDDEE